MDTLLQLFRDHPVLAVAAAGTFFLVTVLPFAGRRFPRLLQRIGVSLIRIVTVPFSFWRRTALDLASRSAGQRDEAPAPLARRLLPAVQSILILGGLLILTAGVLAGWRASGIDRPSGQLKAALMEELPELEGALSDARAELTALDNEWQESRECRREEAEAALIAETGRLSGENATLREFLSRDRQTREVFTLIAGPAPGDRVPEEVAQELRGALPSLGLPSDREWLVTRYIANLDREAELAREFSSLDDEGLRRRYQPEHETVVRVEAELVPAILKVTEELSAPDPGPTFDAAAFAGAWWPSLVLFCGFVWAVGALTELMGSAVPLLGRTHATVDQEGQLKWAE